VKKREINFETTPIAFFTHLSSRERAGEKKKLVKKRKRGEEKRASRFAHFHVFLGRTLVSAGVREGKKKQNGKEGEISFQQFVH